MTCPTKLVFPFSTLNISMGKARKPCQWVSDVTISKFIAYCKATLFFTKDVFSKPLSIKLTLATFTLFR